MTVRLLLMLVVLAGTLGGCGRGPLSLAIAPPGLAAKEDFPACLIHQRVIEVAQPTTRQDYLAADAALVDALRHRALPLASYNEHAGFVPGRSALFGYFDCLIGPANDANADAQSCAANHADADGAVRGRDRPREPGQPSVGASPAADRPHPRGRAPARRRRRRAGPLPRPIYPARPSARGADRICVQVAIDLETVDVRARSTPRAISPPRLAAVRRRRCRRTSCSVRRRRASRSPSEASCTAPRS